MGNAEAGRSFSPADPKHFQVVGHNEAQGTTLLLERNTCNEYCMKELTVNNRQDLDQVNRHIEAKQRHRHPNVLSVVFYRVQPLDGLCSQSARCYIVAEHPFRTLYDEVRDRKRSRDRFSEGELLSILYSCVAGLNHLYEQGFKHESLTSNRIYIDKSGLIKVSDPQLLRQADNLSMLSAHSNKQHIYLSPEQLQASYGRHTQSYCSKLSDAFTLGMILLEAMQLDWMDELYEAACINSKGLKSCLDQIDQKKYGRNLRALVKGMLQRNPEERVTLKEAANFIDGMELPDSRSDSFKMSRCEGAVPPNSLLSSQLHEDRLPSRVVVNIEPLEPHSESVYTDNKLDTCTISPPSNYGPSLESLQETPRSELITRGLHQTVHLSKTVRTVPHKTIQLEVGKKGQQQLKSRHQRRRSRSDKSGRAGKAGYNDVMIFKKKQPIKLQPQPIVEKQQKQPTPQDTPNKIYKQFYPFTEFVRASRGDSGLRQSNKHVNVTAQNQTVFSREEKCIRVDLFSAKKRRTSSKMKNSASISNSPQPSMTVNVRKFETKEPDETTVRLSKPELNATLTELTLKGMPYHLNHDSPADKSDLRLRIKTDFVYEENTTERQAKNDTVNQSVTEFRTRLHMSNSVSLNSPSPLKKDVLVVSMEEDLASGQRLPTEPEPLKKITFGLQQSFIEERNTFQLQPSEYYLTTAAEEIRPISKLELKPTETSLKDSQPLKIDIVVPQLSPLETVIQPSAEQLRRSLKQSTVDEPISPKHNDRPNTELEFISETYKHGGRYEGFKLNNLREGFGRYFYQDGGYYQGQWHRNKMTGFAKLYYQNGDIAYEGYWRDDMFNGTGKLWNDSPQPFDEPFDYRDFSQMGARWLHYNGCFLNDIRIGVGTLTLTNGEVYEGEFWEDQVHGRGKFYALDGSVHPGTWQNDKLKL